MMCYPAVKWLKTWLTISSTPAVDCLSLQHLWKWDCRYLGTERHTNSSIYQQNWEQKSSNVMHQKYPWGEHRDSNKSHTVKKLKVVPEWPRKSAVARFCMTAWQSIYITYTYLRTQTATCVTNTIPQYGLHPSDCFALRVFPYRR